jgi:hypothetical protein
MEWTNKTESRRVSLSRKCYLKRTPSDWNDLYEVPVISVGGSSLFECLSDAHQDIIRRMEVIKVGTLGRTMVAYRLPFSTMDRTSVSASRKDPCCAPRFLLGKPIVAPVIKK